MKEEDKVKKAHHPAEIELTTSWLRDQTSTAVLQPRSQLSDRLKMDSKQLILIPNSNLE